MYHMQQSVFVDVERRFMQQFNISAWSMGQRETLTVSVYLRIQAEVKLSVTAESHLVNSMFYIHAGDNVLCDMASVQIGTDV